MCIIFPIAPTKQGTKKQPIVTFKVFRVDPKTGKLYSYFGYGKDKSYPIGKWLDAKDFHSCSCFNKKTIKFPQTLSEYRSKHFGFHTDTRDYCREMLTWALIGTKNFKIFKVEIADVIAENKFSKNSRTSRYMRIIEEIR